MLEQLRILTVGRFWSGRYRHEWWVLQHQLASKYDSEPLIGEVANTSCSSLTDEPSVFPGSAPGTSNESNRNMRDAGYNDSAMYEGLAQSAIDYTGWRSTRIEFPFNLFRRTDTGRTVVDQDATFSIMKLWRQEFGARAILSTHGFKCPDHPQFLPIMEHIKSLGPLIEFQPDGPKDPDWDATMQHGISAGATVIEVWALSLPTSILKTATPEQFMNWASRLKDNLRKTNM